MNISKTQISLTGHSDTVGDIMDFLVRHYNVIVKRIEEIDDTTSMDVSVAPKNTKKNTAKEQFYCDYQIYINQKFVGETNDPREVQNTIGSYPFGSLYEVHSATGKDVSMFIPY